MSSIQPGTVCKIVNAPQYNGRMVVALERAAGSEFRLPDGHISCSEPGEWCIESLEGEFAVCTTSFRSRTTRFVVCNPRYLKPFDPGTSTDEILLKAGKPKANDLAPEIAVNHECEAVRLHALNLRADALPVRWPRPLEHIQLMTESPHCMGFVKRLPR